MKKPVKVQRTKTNTTLNIPKDWADYLKLEHKGTVFLEMKGNKIIVSKEAK